ncbi:RuBisCO accumulation factor 1 [Almyronema epifaneia]|uniref:RuBisCO accumulation factor 1 n=1 Tax=Almyronema epifaneia S1 TaxID=2991925 RepID=A0ABW6IHY6_9CYAN
MTSTPSNHSDGHATTAASDQAALLQQLRRKQGTWVAWGQACQTLQKAGLSPQKIFEETGFEPIQQNQIIVAAQVYASMLAAGVSEQARSHFQQRGSDLLYELRILSQSDRAQAADLIVQHSLEIEQVREIAKALREYSYSEQPPTGFTKHAGDAVAYHYWRLARQQADLPKRSRLIAQGLRFAHSGSAREQIEKLLLDFTVVKAKPAPKLPIYRLETETELPRLIPVAGEWPLPTEAFKAVPVTLAEEPFGLVKFAEGPGAWVPVPGWQVILQAEDPVGILAQARQLPGLDPNATETVLLVIDRAQRDWRADSYFGVEAGDRLDLQWFDAQPSDRLLGRVILVIRPKRILDEDYTRELWQIDE